MNETRGNKETGEKVERIEEEVKPGGRRCCRHGGLFDPLSLFPPDLSRGHACRVFFNREIHDAGLATCRAMLDRANVLHRRSRARTKNRKSRTGQSKWVEQVGTRSREFRLSARLARAVRSTFTHYIALSTFENCSTSGRDRFCNIVA